MSLRLAPFVLLLVNAFALPPMVAFTNKVREGSEMVTEDLLIPERLYKARSTKMASGGDFQWVRGNSLLVIRPAAILSNGWVEVDGREYHGEYHVFFVGSNAQYLVRNATARTTLTVRNDDRAPNVYVWVLPRGRAESNRMRLAPGARVGFFAHDADSGLESCVAECGSRTASGSGEIEIPAGAKEFRVEAIDRVGNRIERRWTLSVDDRAPEPTVHAANGETQRTLQGIAEIGEDESLVLSARDGSGAESPVFVAFDRPDAFGAAARIERSEIGDLPTRTLFYFSEDAVGNRSPMKTLVLKPRKGPRAMETR